MYRLLSLLTILLAMLVAAGCGQYGQRYTGEKGELAADASERRITDQPFDAAARKADGCTTLAEHEIEGREHTDDPKEKIDYKQNPPTSGKHYGIAAEWGLYDETQADIATVHNLEHGHIVISHKGLSQKDRDALYDHARINSFHLLVQPRAKNPKDGVYYSAWGKQIYCAKPSKAALQHMIDEWRDNGPELYTDDPGEVDKMGSDRRKEG